MGFDLRSEAGAEFRATGSGWTYYLNLAEDYEWKPAGTLPPRGASSSQPWPGSYDTNDNQRVSQQDATAMAVALKAALADPNRTARETALAERLTQAVRAATGSTTYTMRIGDDTAFLTELVKFLECGAFDIS